MKRCEVCHILTDDEQTDCPNDGQPLAEDTLATKLQDALGAKYTLTRLIGKGAMGAVYRARHRDLDDVAIKVMLGPPEDQKLSERFLREARALRKLRHQHTVTVYDLDRSVPGLTYMVMEMVEGHSLREDLRRHGRLSLEETVEVAEAVCDALQAAHERGIIHRDLKPDNILRAQEETVSGHTLRTIKIADFGIVKLRGSQQGGDASMQLTQYGAPIGTPFYMSPEQWFGEGSGIRGLDGRTDIYALGCTLYELLAGRTPFLGRTTSEVRRQHLEAVPQPVTNFAPEVPEAVGRAIARSLEKDRDDRPQSAAEFAAELRRAYNESYLVTARSTHDGLRQTQEMFSGELEDNKDTPSLPTTKDALASGENIQSAAMTGLVEESKQIEEPSRTAESPMLNEVRSIEGWHSPGEMHPAGQEEEALIVEPPGLAEEARIAQHTTEESLQGSIVGYQADLARAWTVQPEEEAAPAAEQENGADEVTLINAPRPVSSSSGLMATGDALSSSSAAVHAPLAQPTAGRKAGRSMRLAVLLVLLVAVVGGLGFLGYHLYDRYIGATQDEAAQSPPPGPLQPLARETVNTTKGTLRLTAPVGSQVFVDDDAVGTVGQNREFATEAATGMRNVRVALGGYRMWIQNVKVATSWVPPVAVELRRAPAPRDGTAEERADRADSLFRAKRYDEAEVELREIIKENPDDLDAHLKLAATYRAQQRYGEAITEYDTAARLDSKNVDTLLALGTLYSIKEHDDAAEATLRGAIRLAPRNAAAHHLLARVLQRRSDKLDEALSEVEQALKLKADEPNYLDTKALILLGRNSLNEALKTAQRAQELNKTRDLKYKADIAAILYRMGQRDEAAQAYRQIRQADTNDEWEDLRRLELTRGYSKPVLEIFSALITKTN